MTLFSKGSSAAKTSLVYITVGSLVLVWTGIYMVWLFNHPPETDGPRYWCAGLFASGLTLLAIGFCIGRIGRSAHPAEPITTTTSPTEQAVLLQPNLQVPAVAPVPPVVAAPPVAAVPPVTAAPAGSPVGVSGQAPVQR